MRHSGPIRSTALATLLLLLSSCVATQLPPISSQGRSFKPLSDETRLWEQSRDEEAKLLDHGKLKAQTAGAMDAGRIIAWAQENVR